jgi:MFS family permease
VEFGWTRAITSGAFSLSLILAGLLGVVTGKINDKFGPRLVLTAGALVLGLGYSLMSQISAVWQIYLFYGVLIGTGFSGYIVVLLSTTARWFAKRRSMMTGIVMAGTGTGTMLMPLLGGWLISSYGWRTSYIIMGAISLILITSVTQFLRRDPQSKGLLPDGKAELKQESQNSGADGLSFREATRTWQYWMLWAVFLFLGFSQITVMVHIVIHATGLGIPPASAVSVLSIIGGANIAGRIVMGTTGDKIGNKLAIIIGIILMSASLFWLLAAKEVWMLYLFGVIFGFAWGGSFVQMSPITAELFGLKAHGVLIGLINFGITIGGTIGPVLIGYIFDITSSYQTGFLILAAVSLIGLILALLLRPVREQENTGLDRKPKRR